MRRTVDETTRRLLLRRKRTTRLKRVELALRQPSATGVPPHPATVRSLGLGDDAIDFKPSAADGADALHDLAASFPPFVYSYFCIDDARHAFPSAPGVFDSTAAVARRDGAVPVEHSSNVWTKAEKDALAAQLESQRKQQEELEAKLKQLQEKPKSRACCVM